VPFTSSVIELIEQRYSCRTYLDLPLQASQRQRLAGYLTTIKAGPLGTPGRFKLVAASEQDHHALRGLGTYGIIRGATGYLIGTVSDAAHDMEDFGYMMEQIILFATELGLGTCWLGGTFTRSSFAANMDLQSDESMPCVVSVGHIASHRSLVDRFIRRDATVRKRWAWPALFFDRHFGRPLSREAAADHAVPLEMVRLAPSASNKQPWRVVHLDGAWHFYLQRNTWYGERNMKLLLLADLQRIDLGIAMSHFELTARELGLAGSWQIEEPVIAVTDPRAEYVVTWQQA
jgi:nitroreductase